LSNRNVQLALPNQMMIMASSVLLLFVKLIWLLYNRGSWVAFESLQISCWIFHIHHVAFCVDCCMFLWFNHV